jgi:hypothetical protein
MSKPTTVLFCEKYRIEPQRSHARAVGLDVFYEGQPLVVPVGRQLMVPLQMSARFGAIWGTAVQQTHMLYFRIATPRTYAKLEIGMTGPHYDVVESSAAANIGPLDSPQVMPPPYNNFAFGEVHVLVTNYSATPFTVESGSRVGQLVCYNQRNVEESRWPIAFSNNEAQHLLRCGTIETRELTITTTEIRGHYIWKVVIQGNKTLRDFSDGGRKWAVFTIDLGHYMIGEDSRWLDMGVVGVGLQVLDRIVDSDYKGQISVILVADVDGLKQSEFTVCGFRTETIIPRIFIGEHAKKWAAISADSFVVPSGCIELGHNREAKPRRGIRGFEPL